eukprot:GHVN01027569.1.p1 GENE.GHVN01027569.1~~GHVN01027569.1.p1  ORF type:complete len:323 (+),score=48.85 GHVN01027569.1:86-1054(+)
MAFQSNPLTKLKGTNKVLLMGRAGAGKTSMRSIIFAQFRPRDTTAIGATNMVENSNMRFLGDMVLALWDCGGQDTFMENYFDSQREQIFRDAKVLIYVLEVRGTSVKQLQTRGDKKGVIASFKKDVQYFKNACENIKQFSPRAKVFYLIHKFDIVEDVEKDAMKTFYQNELKPHTEDLATECFTTSIWNETLFAAWSTITQCLIHNIGALTKNLSHFCEVLNADEVILFERSTFLVICESTRVRHDDNHRFEKISNICKQFKLTCARASESFMGMTVVNPYATTYIEVFTKYTYIMVISSDKDLQLGAILQNIDFAKEHFDV